MVALTGIERVKLCRSSARSVSNRRFPVQLSPQRRAASDYETRVCERIGARAWHVLQMDRGIGDSPRADACGVQHVCELTRIAGELRDALLFRSSNRSHAVFGARQGMRDLQPRADWPVQLRPARG